MTVKQKLVRGAVMYSVDEHGGVVTHHLPWPKDSPKIEPLKARGFTFDKPFVEMPLISKEDVMGVGVMPPTIQDKRVAALEKARAAKKAKAG